MIENDKPDLLKADNIRYHYLGEFHYGHLTGNQLQMLPQAEMQMVVILNQGVCFQTVTVIFCKEMS